MKVLLSTIAFLSSIAYTVGQSCTVPATVCANPITPGTYAPEQCFPNMGACYPTNYYAAQDQGQFSSTNGAFATQISARCQAACSSNTQCASYVGIFNTAADGRTATGTCFYYSVQQIYPRQCADAPTGIVAYYKQRVCPTSTTSATKSITKSTTTTSSTTRSTTASTTTSSSPTATPTQCSPAQSSICGIYCNCDLVVADTSTYTCSGGSYCYDAPCTNTFCKTSYGPDSVCVYSTGCNSSFGSRYGCTIPNSSCPVGTATKRGIVRDVERVFEVARAKKMARRSKVSGGV